MNPVAKFTNFTIFHYARAKITNFTNFTFFSCGDAKIAEFTNLTILTIFRYCGYLHGPVQIFSPENGVCNCLALEKIYDMLILWI